MSRFIVMSRRSVRLASKTQVNYNEAKVAKTRKDDTKKVEKQIKVKKSPLKRKVTKTDVKAEIKPVKLEPTDNGGNGAPGNMYIGCHTSISGGIWKAAEEAMAFGAKAFGLFLHSQQQWKMKALEESHAERFQETCKKLGYAPKQIVPHGSYLMNCGSPKEEVKIKSDAMLIEELKRCEALGLIYFNFHPGSTLGKISVEECLTMIADAINKAHQATKYVIVLLENMSCQGNTVGGKFQELRDIIEKVDDKTRIGVCIDTCHSHAAGYDLSTADGYEIFTQDLESIIGWKYVKAFHLNDSKGPSGCNKDRHENIGKGTIGLKGFERLVNDPRMAGIPMILETPYKNDEIYKQEIKLLYSLID